MGLWHTAAWTHPQLPKGGPSRADRCWLQRGNRSAQLTMGRDMRDGRGPQP